MNSPGNVVGALTNSEIAKLLRPYVAVEAAVPHDLYNQLALYLELLLRWNARTNLTAIREPTEIVRRHFGESLFAAQHLGECETLMDFGSGAGFPGLPIQLFRPLLKVTLAESQNKKATFLRETVRTLSLPTTVWSGRVEQLPPDQKFDVVTMRAVDDAGAALEMAASRARARLVLLSTFARGFRMPEHFELEATVALVQSSKRALFLLRRANDDF